MHVLITGTSRGIGLELTRLGLEKGHHVLAVARNPDGSKELMELKKKFDHLRILALDLKEAYALKIISDQVGQWPCLDVVVNNAGIYLQEENLQSFQDSFLTNSTLPFLVTKTLFDFLKKSSRPVSLQITSQMGSLADNTSGGSYSYRASKAALNMIFKSLSIDEKWLISLLVHPGWVKTRMGGEAAPLSPRSSAEGIWHLIEAAQMRDSGRFYNYKQEELPW